MSDLANRRLPRPPHPGEDHVRPAGDVVGQGVASDGARTPDHTVEHPSAVSPPLDAVWLLDAAGRVTHATPAAERLLGWPADVLRGGLLHDHVCPPAPDPAAHPAAECPLHAAAADRATGPADAPRRARWRRRGDATVDVQFGVAPLRADGRLAGAVVTARDWTAWERDAGDATSGTPAPVAPAPRPDADIDAAAAMAADLPLVGPWRDAALLAGGVGTFAWDTVRQRVWGDANVARLLGVTFDTADAAIGTAPLERHLAVVHPHDRARVREAIARTVAEGVDYEVEYRVMDTAGAVGDESDPSNDGARSATGGSTAAVRWLLVRAKPERDARGRVVRAPGVCVDVTARRRGEEVLHQQTTLLQAISDATGDVIYAKDRDGRFTYGNPATFAVIGRPAGAVLGRTDAEVLADAAAARRVTENDRRIMADGQAQELEEVVPLPDGTHRVWASYKMPYRDARGAVVGLLGVSRDITERKAIERALADERALLGAVLEQMPIGVSIAEAGTGRLLHLNAAGQALLGHPPIDASGTADYARYGARHADGTPYEPAEYPLARALAGETVVEELMRYVRADGTTVALLVSAAPVYDADGRLVRAVCTWSDVTARLALEEALRAARERFEAIIQSIDDGLLVLDHAWRYTYVSERAARIVGVTPADMLGGVVWELFPHAEGTRFHEGYHRAVATGEPVHFEEYYPAPIDKWLECHCYPGREGLTVLFRDVTARKAAEAERERLLAAAEAANRTKTAFLTNMSHELRTPLNAIGGHVQLVAMGLHGPVTDAQGEALGRARRAQQHLLALIHDILEFARLDAATVTFDVRPVAVGEVLDAVRCMVEPQAAEKGLAFEVHVPDPALRVHADHDRLVQVLLNLVANAVKYTPARQADGTPGRVRVAVTRPADAPEHVDLQVVDSGIGVPADRLESIFEPFVQVATGLTDRTGGAGLGLAISRDLARGMGGDITAQSTLGAGATFTVRLRRAG